VGFGMAGPEIGDLDLSTGSVSTAWRPFETSPELARSSAGLEGPSPFVAAVSEGSGDLLLGGGTEYRLFRFDPRTHAAQEFGRAELEPEKPSGDERRDLEERMRRVFGAQADPHTIERMLDRPKPFYTANGIAADAAGRTWVSTT